MNVKSILEYLDEQADHWDESADCWKEGSETSISYRKIALINREAARLIRQGCRSRKDPDVVIIPKWLYLLMPRTDDAIKKVGRKASYKEKRAKR